MNLPPLIRTIRSCLTGTALVGAESLAGPDELDLAGVLWQPARARAMNKMMINANCRKAICLSGPSANGPLLGYWFACINDFAFGGACAQPTSLIAWAVAASDDI